MTTTIAISGKGGSGKTTLAAMIIRSLVGQSGCGSLRRDESDYGGLRPGESAGAVLAVDADPNSCLGMTMGVEPAGVIAEVREKAVEKSPSNAGVDRVRSFEYGIQQAITEGAGFDLLTMGRPEGPGCYCAANNLLRKFMDKLSSSYGFVVIDNEAGMEHLSRRTTNNVDILCIAAEATPIGEITTRRIYELAKKLPISVGKIGVIWNRSKIGKELDDIETFGSVPYDKTVLDASMQRKSIFDIEADSPAFVAVREILEHKLEMLKTKS